MSKIKKPNNIEEEQFIQSISNEKNKDAKSTLDNDEINSEIERASVQFEESINNLASDIKPIALLGLTKRFQIREIPAPYKVISVRIKKNILKEFELTLGDLVYPLNNNFQGNPEDENIALNYLINHEGILDKIMLELRKARIESSINIADHQTLVFKVDEKLNSLHNKLDDLHEENIVSQISISGLAKEKTIPSDISDLEAQTDRIRTAETNYANFRSLQTAINCENLEIKKPRNGECVYLMIDQNLLNQNSKDPNLQKIINEINSIIRSPNFHLTCYNGYLTIIGTAERGGSSLASMAGRMYRTVQAKMFLGTGGIKNKDNNFNITGFPKLKDRNTWNTMNEGVYMTQEFESLITDPTNRNSALCTIESRETENNLIKLYKCNLLIKPTLF